MRPPVFLVALALVGCAATPTPCPSLAPGAPGPEPSASPPQPPPDGTPFAVVRQQNFRMVFGDYALEVNPTDGARILEFSLADRNALVARAESTQAYGSSFWPSPQSDWSWPPPPEFDSLPWRVSVEGKALVLKTETNQKLGLAAEQRILAEPDTGSVLLSYSIINRGTSPRSVAPWQNTRVRPGGLTFYPSDEATYPESSLKLLPEDGITWYAHAPKPQTESLKSYGNGLEGWLAQVDGELLFIKSFQDVPKDAQAPKEGEVVLYVDGGGKFVEIEQQGVYVELVPGSALRWNVRWLLRRLPQGFDAQKGSRALVAYVRETLGGMARL